MVFIQDGKGGGKNASVSSTNRLDVSSRQNPRIFYVSRDNGQAYSWSSTTAAQGGSVVFYLQNISPTRDLIIDDIHITAGSGAVGATYEVWTATGIGGGTVVSGTNLNFNSSNSPEARAFGNEHVTGEASGLQLGVVGVGAVSTVEFPIHDAIILGQNDALIVKKTIGPSADATDSCMVEGYFE